MVDPAELTKVSVRLEFWAAQLYESVKLSFLSVELPVLPRGVFSFTSLTLSRTGKTEEYMLAKQKNTSSI